MDKNLIFRLRECAKASSAWIGDSLNDIADRLECIDAERDELAAQVGVMRDALRHAVNSVEPRAVPIWASAAMRALAITQQRTAAAILRQRDAMTLREAAAIAVEWGNARKPGQGGHALWNYADHIRTKADELESKNG